MILRNYSDAVIRLVGKTDKEYLPISPLKQAILKTLIFRSTFVFVLETKHVVLALKN